MFEISCSIFPINMLHFLFTKDKMSSEEQAPQLKDLDKKSKDDNKADPKKAEEEEEIGKNSIKFPFIIQFFFRY